MLSLESLDMDLIIAVGPLKSAPCVGLIPSDNGVHAARPPAEAPVSCPNGVLFDMDKVP